MNSLESFAKFIPATNNSLIIASATASAILTDSELKARRFTSGLNDSLYELANEPSIGFFRIQEHVRKSIPVMIEKVAEVDQFTQKIKGHSFDLDYSHDAISRMARSDATLDSTSRLLTDSLYIARQLNIRSKINPTHDQANSPSTSKSLLSRVRKQNKTTIGLDLKAGSSPKESEKPSLNNGLTSINLNDDSKSNQLGQPPQRSQTMIIASNESILETNEPIQAKSVNSTISEEN